MKEVLAVEPFIKQAQHANICSQKHDLHIMALLLRQLPVEPPEHVSDRAKFPL